MDAIKQVLCERGFNLFVRRAHNFVQGLMRLFEDLIHVALLSSIGASRRFLLKLPKFSKLIEENFINALRVRCDYLSPAIRNTKIAAARCLEQTRLTKVGLRPMYAVSE